MGNPWVNGEFVFDLSENNIFTKDEENYINGLGVQQLNTVGQLYLLDIFLSEGNYVDLHYHSNASELTYCISGLAVIYFINPTTNEWKMFTLKPGEAISIPQGFWHCAEAIKDETHLLATHDTDNLQTVFGSDLLRLTPKELMASIYCLDEVALENVLSPIDETIVIGPPVDCERVGDVVEENDSDLGFLQDESCSDDVKVENGPQNNAESRTNDTEHPGGQLGMQSRPIPLYNKAISPNSFGEK